MPSLSLATALSVIVGISLLNVWLLRSGSPSPFRGADARSLRAEFRAYGLPGWMFYLVGGLKVGAALALIAGVWFPALLTPAAGVVVVLMLGALAMHAKVRDPLVRSLPALAILFMSGGALLL